MPNPLGRALSEPVSLQPPPGVVAPSGATWSRIISTAGRWQPAVIAEVAMVAAWFVIRTTAGADSGLYALWVAVGCVLALVAPTSGLVVFVASSAFYEPGTLTRALAPRELMLVALAAGVGGRIALDRFRWRPEPAVWIAVLLAVGTGLGVVNTFTRFDEAFGWHAGQSWLNNIGGAVILLVTAAWCARRGELRVLVVACGVAVVAAVASLTEYFAPGLVSGSPLGWVGFWKDFLARIGGTVPSPNALSAQLIMPTTILLAAVVFARDVRLRVAAVVSGGILLLTHYLTFSRSPILGLYAFLVIVAWRVRRAFGAAVLVVGLVGGLLILPSYLEFRSTAGNGGAVISGSLLVATDQDRLRAWGAASRMWLDEPVIGQGYLAYRQLGKAFGDPVAGSPHNEWLRLFAEGGVLVGLVGLAFVATAFWSLATIRGWLGTGILAGFVAYVIAAAVNNPLLFIRVSAVNFAIIGTGLALASIQGSGSLEPSGQASTLSTAQPTLQRRRRVKAEGRTSDEHRIVETRLGR